MPVCQEESGSLNHPYGVSWIWTVLNLNTAAVATSGLCNCEDGEKEGDKMHIEGSRKKETKIEIK